MAIKQTLVGLGQTDLNDIVTACKNAIIAGAVRGSSYTIAGRSFTFASMSEAASLLQEANYALSLLTGTRSMNIRANFNRAIGRGSR